MADFRKTMRVRMPVRNNKRPTHLPARFFLSSLVLIVCSQTSFSQNTPEVSKVEPPGWWARSSINPVRLLIRGRNLNNARVTTNASGLQIGSMKVNGAGTYLFVDVIINQLAKPATYHLRITTATGA